MKVTRLEYPNHVIHDIVITDVFRTNDNQIIIMYNDLSHNGDLAWTPLIKEGASYFKNPNHNDNLEEYIKNRIEDLNFQNEFLNNVPEVIGLYHTRQESNEMVTAYRKYEVDSVFNLITDNNLVEFNEDLDKYRNICYRCIQENRNTASYLLSRIRTIVRRHRTLINNLGNESYYVKYPNGILNELKEEITNFRNNKKPETNTIVASQPRTTHFDQCVQIFVSADRRNFYITSAAASIIFGNSKNDGSLTYLTSEMLIYILNTYSVNYFNYEDYYQKKPIPITLSTENIEKEIVSYLRNNGIPSNLISGKKVKEVLAIVPDVLDNTYYGSLTVNSFSHGFLQHLKAEDFEHFKRDSDTSMTFTYLKEVFTKRFGDIDKIDPEQFNKFFISLDEIDPLIVKKDGQILIYDFVGCKYTIERQLQNIKNVYIENMDYKPAKDNLSDGLMARKDMIVNGRFCPKYSGDFFDNYQFNEFGDTEPIPGYPHF